MTRFKCPSCDEFIVHPKTICSNNCVSLISFAVPGSESPGAIRARETADRLAKTVSALQGTELYLSATQQGMSSKHFQELIKEDLISLGYVDERHQRVGLAGFRPDFILDIPGDGVLVEVERGKTIDNNMDMLDMWKCHVHQDARHLILLVPVWYVKRKTDGGSSQTPTFSKVCVRLAQFFEPENYTNVMTLHILGF